MFRLALVPVFAIFYFANFQYHYYFAIITLGVSGLSDIVDGTIARKCNMISNFGKIIDPLADKLTQGIAVICLSIQHPVLVPLLILFCAKEFTMMLGAYHLIKLGTRPSESKWWGKLSTVMMFTFIVIVLLTDIYPAVPFEFVAVAAVLTAICLLFSLFNYYPVFKDIQSGAYDVNTESKVEKEDNDSKKEE